MVKVLPPARLALRRFGFRCAARVVSVEMAVLRVGSAPMARFTSAADRTSQVSSDASARLVSVVIVCPVLFPPLLHGSSRLPPKCWRL